MSTDLKKINRDLLEDFILEYKNHPCLWRIKSKEYHDKQKRDAAYNALLLKYKQIDPNADKDIVAKKINSMRTNYRREKKKVSDSSRSGAGLEDLYEPSLWYFSLLSFIDEQETPRASESNFEDEVSYYSRTLYRNRYKSNS